MALRGRLLEQVNLIGRFVAGLTSLHRLDPAPFSLISELALVLALYKLWIVLVEVCVAFLKKVHLREKDLLAIGVGALGSIDAAVQVTKITPQARAALLTILTMENDNSALEHQLT